MKSNVLAVMMAITILGTTLAPSAHALSCLPTDMYLSSIIGDEETVVFIGTSVARTDTDDYTSEVVTVTEALQGYVEAQLFVYHERHSDWGYLCNAGPQAKGATGVYVAFRDSLGTYNVTQRLTLDEPITENFLSEIKAAEIEGGIGEITAIDQQNRAMTTIIELFSKISRLLTEFAYWKSQR